MALTTPPFPQLIKLFKFFFKTHNQFTQDDKKITAYLKEQVKENKLLTQEKQGQVTAALFLVNFGQNKDDTHKLYKFRHFAFTSVESAQKLLRRAEDVVKKSSKTSKIELTIAQSEPGIKFYLQNGYKKEAALTNHYRWGETCYVLAKSFSK